MTLEELEAACDKAEKNFAEHTLGWDEPAFTLTLPREIKGERARVMPGVMSKAVFVYGSKYNPSIVLVRVSDVRKFIARIKGEQKD